MKCNIRELALFSDRPCVIEGRLNYKKVFHSGYRQHSVFKERWFRLINNYLFYFKISEMGKFATKQPEGVFVTENISVQMEHGQSIPFSFSISFIDEADKKHIFAARSEENVVQWVMKLRESSYEYLRCRLHTLQSKIYCITGKDPLLMVPRNDGACLWAPSEPFSSAPACSANGIAFSCHLHTGTAFALERSKSDVQAHAHRRKHANKPAKFYNDDALKQDNNKPLNFELERSHTTVLPRTGPIGAIFDSGALRAAPSPPARTRLSPAPPRADLQAFTVHGRLRGTAGILDAAPVKPSRRPSPRHTPSSVHVSHDSQPHSQSVQEDLIKF